MGFLLDKCSFSPLDEEVIAGCHPFSCGNADLDEFLQHDAPLYSRQMLGSGLFCHDIGQGAAQGNFNLLNLIEHEKAKFLVKPIKFDGCVKTAARLKNCLFEEFQEKDRNMRLAYNNQYCGYIGRRTSCYQKQTLLG